ncbi:hypothetical protein [Acinetobacter haemolyticus]|uniref:hypothetical protein n=1 Tax=Acinetobacter haemolyticus TaxID=29430 RepID=UPI001331D6DE|nr:hypothetical protein [Acinetobacter haemolyticus]QHI17092.1 hypothetical protein AhaeAN4_11095 [Acinetobacter haemolyticus]
MNAIDFIQKHGVEKARECIEEANAYCGFWVNAKTLELSKQIPSYDAVSIPDIQRLVESVELIKSYGGIINAKMDIRYLDIDWDYDSPRRKRLEQAIADYEQLFGNGETLELETLRDCDTSPNCKKFDERVK